MTTLLQYNSPDEGSFVIWCLTDIMGVIVKSNNERFPLGEVYMDYDKYAGRYWSAYDEEIVLKNGEKKCAKR